MFSLWNKSVLSIGQDGSPSRLLESALVPSFATKGGTLEMKPEDIQIRDANGVILDSASGAYTKVPESSCSARATFPDVGIPSSFCSQFLGCWPD